MDSKKQVLIKLFDLIGSDIAIGNQEGREVYVKLMAELDKYPGENIFGISLAGVRATDASFPRESVVSLIKAKKGEIGFFLQDFVSTDLLDNWNYAAIAKGQPIIVLSQGSYEVIGPALNASAKDLLSYIMEVGTTTTSQVAEKFNISAQNASSKLKKMLLQGIVLGAKEAAESGGIEYVYRAIK
ncbi:helix-turn-helix transcriptional regulator [Desulfosediminicola ganghwensis]|uniref:helix-turn-helix transcriptional regulator n=1 Tax=Desulfosediminicola ganghwensis TaxID=2569540 RepID=UPI0010ABF193|nr:helix-turn-helix transcriptional regulator [Desulfosediminicola ganghwensis]